MRLLIVGLTAAMLLTGTAAWADRDDDHGWRGERSEHHDRNWERERQARHWERERREHAEQWYGDRYYYPTAPVNPYYDPYYGYSQPYYESGPGFYFSWSD